jgi:hypothetical protein
MTTNALTPDKFWNQFIQQLSATLVGDQHWPSKWASAPEWTTLMNQVLRQTGEALGFRERNTISQEHLRLDMAFWSHPHRSDPFEEFWNVEVAIEHENNSETWFEEWVKLSHITCGLKVLITYHHHRPGKETLTERLDRVGKLHTDLKYRLAADNWLLIFGPADYGPTDKTWFAYTFDGSAFALLGTNNRVFPEDVQLAAAES